MAFEAPVADIAFWLRVVTDLDGEIAAGLHSELSADLVDAVLTEAGRFATSEIAPLNQIGDRVGATIADGVVTMPPGWKDVFARWTDGGWTGLTAAPAHGGQGLPVMIQAAVLEMWNAASMAFATGPMLTGGAIEALEAHGSDEQKALYLAKLVEGRWTGTMNLTEPQAGSDLGALRTGRNRRVTAATGSSAPRSSSPTASTTSPRTSSTSCSRACPTHRPVRAASRSSWCRNSCRTPPATPVSATTSRPSAPRAQARHPCLTHLRHAVRRARRRGRLAGGRAQPRARGHVHDDEQRPSLGRRPGCRRRRARLPARPRLCARTPPGPGAGLDRGGDEPDRPPSRCQAHAPNHARPHRRRPRALLRPRPRHRPVPARSRGRACPLGRSRRAADPDRQSIRDRRQLRGRLARRAGSRWYGFIEETGAAQHLRDARILSIYEGTNGIQAIDLVTRKLPLAGGATVDDLIAEYAAIVDAARDGSEARIAARSIALSPISGRRRAPCGRPGGRTHHRRAGGRDSLPPPLRDRRRGRLSPQGGARRRPG